MTRPTTTRAALRQAIGTELAMPFYIRFGTQLNCDTSANTTTTAIADAHLVQANDFWNGNWCWDATQLTARYISDYALTNGVLTLESALPLTAATGSGDAYEITSVFSPAEIHSAINRAIADGFPSFFDEITDETIVVQEDKLSYDLTGLTTRPWIIYKIFVEMNSEVIRGTATAGGATSITDSTQDFSDLTTAYKVSIYAGTGTGQCKAVVSGTAGGVINVAAFSPSPDTTSKYAVWNPVDEDRPWYQLIGVKFDQVQYPGTMYLQGAYTEVLGMRLRIQCCAVPSELATEIATTCVPKEFIISKAVSMLARAAVNRNRADRQRYEDVEDRYLRAAEYYRQSNAFRVPSATLWQEGSGMPSLTDNPMGWQDAR
jgi:hypothetical protein